MNFSRLCKEGDLRTGTRRRKREEEGGRYIRS